jgi:hypothetical protein
MHFWSLLHDDIEPGTRWPCVGIFWLLKCRSRLLQEFEFSLCRHQKMVATLSLHQSNMSYFSFACLNVCYGGLPQEMICKGCMETSKEKAIRNGICLDKNDTRTTRMTCQQPFHSEWRNHYHQKKRLRFCKGLGIHTAAFGCECFWSAFRYRSRNSCRQWHDNVTHSTCSYWCQCEWRMSTPT